MSRFARYGLPVVLYAGLIVYLSSRSHLPGPPLAHGLDKAAHFTEYALLGGLVGRALTGYGVRPQRALSIALLGALLFAATDELHQRFTERRAADVADWMADGLGAAAGAWAYTRSRQPGGERS